MGFRTMTMAELASQLGMSKKTLYQNFVDKQAIVAAIIEQEIASTQEECYHTREKSQDAVHEILITLECFTRDFKDVNPIVMSELQKFYPTVYQKFIRHKDTFVYTIISNNLKRGIEEKLYRSDINVDVLTKFRLESIFMAFDQRVYPSNKYNLVITTSVLIEHFLYGIVTEKGFKLINKYKNIWNKR